MTLDELAQLMLEHGLVIRAITPKEQTHLFDPRHQKAHPDGEIKYSEEFKREMLHVPYRNSLGGKFIITADRGQSATVHWPRGTVFYDSLEEAVEAFVKSLSSANEA